MKTKKNLVTAIAMIIMFLSGVGAVAQTVTVPPPAGLFQFARADTSNGFTEDMMERTVGRNGIAINSVPAARIWGWSQNGRVAYSTEKYGMIGVTINFVILNLITDRIVFEHKISFTEDEEFTVGELYNAHANTIRQAMRTHGIVERQVEYRPLPINHNGATYNVEIRATYFNSDGSAANMDGDNSIEGCEFDYFPARIRDYSVILHNGAGQSKTIKTTRNVCRMDVYQGGYFVSPFENRALIIMAEKQFAAFEETYIDFRFIGAHLETGFR